MNNQGKLNILIFFYSWIGRFDGQNIWKKTSSQLLNYISGKNTHSSSDRSKNHPEYTVEMHQSFVKHTCSKKLLIEIILLYVIL